QIGGIETFGEPVVDFGEHRARFVALAVLREQPRQAHRRAQLQYLRALLARILNGPAKAVLSFYCLSIILPQQQLSFDPMTFSFVLMILMFVRGSFRLRQRS